MSQLMTTRSWMSLVHVCQYTEVATNSTEPAVLDFGQIVDALMVGERGTLALYNMTLQNAAPRNILKTDSHARYKIIPFGPWPSLTVLPNATVILNRTRNTYDSEPQWNQCLDFQNQFRNYASSWAPTDKLLDVGNDTLYISGAYTRFTRIVDLVINDTVGFAEVVSIDNSILCRPNAPLPTALAPAPGPGVVATAAGNSEGSSGGQSKVTWWIIAVAVIAGVAAIATGILAAFLVKRKRSPREEPPKAPEPLLKDDHFSERMSASVRSRSLPRGYSGDVDSISARDEERLTEDEDRLSELPSSNKGKSLTNLLSLPETLRQRSSCMVDSLELGTPLGRGSYGKVYKGSECYGFGGATGKWKGVTVAVKIVEHNAETESELVQLRESLLSSSVVHPNVIATYKVRTVRVVDERAVNDSANDGSGHVTRPANPPKMDSSLESTKGPEVDGGSQDMRETWMLLEYADRGNLDRALVHKKLMLDNGCLDMDAVCRCLIDIAAGMDYLHSLGVLHGDLKGANVLLKSTNDDPRGYTCKLADFGLSRVLETHATHVSTKTYGTLAYMPAELLQDGRMSRAADVYSFAMIMWELFACKRLYEGHIASQVFFKVLMGCRPNMPESMPEGFRKLMMDCWDTDATKRPPFEEVHRRLQLLHEDVMANPPAAASVPVATAVSESPAASSGSGGNQPALPGWEERIMSAVNTPAGSQLALQAGQFCSREQQQGDSATSRSISLGETSSYSQSLQKLESGILPQVFSTRDSYDAPGGFGSVPRSQEERNPMHAALAAQAITAQVMSLHSTPVGSAADPPGSQGGTAAGGRPAALDRRVSFRDGGHPVPGVLTWRPPASRSTSDLVGGVPSGGSPQVLGMLPALSAEYFQQPSPNQHPATVRSAFADAAQAPSNSNPRPQLGTRALPGSAAEVEMVEHAGETGGSDNATASQGDGLPMPDVVAEWFKTASFRNEAAAMQQPINVKDDAEGGDFAESMPLELGRNRRRHQ
ncbi:kinase-like protein [Coccomyxa subellipsoidea C-169]|uniref:Kinase-like protein n=1 Tax=Coccomyxa subellipsoidea (strain C-169) TaxID=574566 RepID=I0YZV5_COCSC|nr:kinase-like protein [Coccomyxa subellipsoidea C-169]EIE23924.1 kinase-like protein [Coccomyxa subellipsoidea C-169]|eukprot:XP_005648468.1 kinase-like protein [Coccomyxa subellipsoidea C-169]